MADTHGTCLNGILSQFYQIGSWVVSQITICNLKVLFLKLKFGLSLQLGCHQNVSKIKVRRQLANLFNFIVIELLLPNFLRCHQFFSIVLKLITILTATKIYNQISFLGVCCLMF